MKDDYIEVIDDFLEPSYFRNLYETVTSIKFPWFFSENISNDEDRQVSINGNSSSRLLGFSHSVCDGEQVDSKDMYPLLCPFAWKILDHVGGSGVLRIRFDMTVFTETGLVHEPHVDYLDTPNYSAVFYLTKSDGPTIIFNEKYDYDSGYPERDLTIKEVIQPKPNRIVIFDGSYIHTGNPPTESSRRIIINTNIQP